MRHAVFSLLLICGADTCHAQGRRDPVPIEDRAAIESCLKLVDANSEQQARQKELEPNEKPDAAGRLAAAARQALVDRASCIGAVSIRCIDAPGGSTTAGMNACLGRELAVWEERLNRAYRQALKGTSPKLAGAIRATQRAWLQWRDQRCRIPAFENEGGSIVGPETQSCRIDATAHQAIWLEQRSQ
jgi:uncharacterized protein YecT (DUF1311 family)